VCVGDALKHPFEVLPEFEGPVLGASMQQLWHLNFADHVGVTVAYELIFNGYNRQNCT
jgi:hypothetical protein